MTIPEKLFTPIRLGKLEVRNRIVCPPLVTGYGTPSGEVTDGHLKWYETFARGGTGLIVVEFAYVCPDGAAGPDHLGIWHDGLIPGLHRLTDRIHAFGAMVAVQLGHAGRQTASAFIGGIPTLAPSAISCPLREPILHETPKELSVEEIEEIVGQFSDAARRAKEAGFDGVELHGAHGYLISGFMSAYSNKRHDAYGGDLQGRMRFPLEIIGRIKREVGQDYPVGFRFSGDEHVPDGRTIAESRRVARLLEAAGVDWLHVSAGVYGSFWSLIPPYGVEEGVNVPEAAAIKEVVGIPVITVGRIKSPEIAEEILRENKADMVALGRQLICDPDWPLKTAAGQLDDIRPCIGCTQGCINRQIVEGKPSSCIYNPEAGWQGESMTRAEVQKTVLIAGGGPGGLEAARVAALRGHKVRLLEKDGKVGGRFSLACVGPFKQEFALAIKWLFGQVSKLGVKVELNREVTPEVVKEIDPDVLIVATGAVAQMPAIPGIDRQGVVFGEDVLAGKATMGANVAVIGGGGVGTEVADFMAQRGKKVTLVEMMPEIGPPTGISVIVTQALMPRLLRNGVEVKVGWTAKEIIDGGIVISKDGGEEVITGIDQVIVATGLKPTNELATRLEGKVPEIYVIGDARAPRTAFEATHEAAEVARII